jgi:hypothetical protein
MADILRYSLVWVLSDGTTRYESAYIRRLQIHPTGRRLAFSTFARIMAHRRHCFWCDFVMVAFPSIISNGAIPQNATMGDILAGRHGPIYPRMPLTIFFLGPWSYPKLNPWRLRRRLDEIRTLNPLAFARGLVELQGPRARDLSSQDPEARRREMVERT